MLYQDIHYLGQAYFNFRPDWSKPMLLEPIWSNTATETYKHKRQSSGRKTRPKWQYSFTVSFLSREDYSIWYLKNEEAVKRVSVVPMWPLHTTATITLPTKTVLVFNNILEVSNIYAGDYVLVTDDLGLNSTFEAFAKVRSIDKVGLTLTLEQPLTSDDILVNVHVIPCLVGVYLSNKVELARISIANYEQSANFKSL